MREIMLDVLEQILNTKWGRKPCDDLDGNHEGEYDILCPEDAHQSEEQMALVGVHERVEMLQVLMLE
jgi:hypothetical protein